MIVKGFNRGVPIVGVGPGAVNVDCLPVWLQEEHAGRFIQFHEVDK